MTTLSNALLTARGNNSSKVEQIGDFLLWPARNLFGGRRVLSLPNKSLIVKKECAASTLKCLALKVAAFILSPLTFAGAFAKACCFISPEYRSFCGKKISQTPSHPKLYEMYQHVYSTADFVTLEGHALVFNPLELYECACITGAFNRLSSRRRDNLENGVVQHLSSVSLDKTKPLHLLSMGSGGMMSDFITLEKLIIAGFTSITMDCVEPQGINADSLEKIRKFFIDYPEVTVTLNAFLNVSDIPEGNPYSAILAIDYDSLDGFDFQARFSAAADLVVAERKLHPSGVMALGHSKMDAIAGRLSPLSTLSVNQSFISTIALDIEDKLPLQPELTLNLPYSNFAQRSHLFMCALALAAQKRNINYNKISISLIKIGGESVNSSFKQMVQKMFPAAEVEIGLQNDNKCDLMFTGEMEEIYENEGYLSFLNPTSTTYVLSAEGSLNRHQGHSTDKVNVLTVIGE